jgi:hypothetical protein
MNDDLFAESKLNELLDAGSKVRELIGDDKDAQALDATLQRLLELTARAVPHFAAIQSGDPVRIAEAKEPVQTALREYELLINEMILRFNVVTAKFGNFAIQEQFRKFISKLSLPFEAARERLNLPEVLFRSTGKEIGDA